MKPKSFTEIVQAGMAFLIVGTFLLLAIRDNSYKDALIAAAAAAYGFWIGSSRSSQMKDEKP